MIITADLKVEAQCSAACIKANRMLGLIKRTLVNRSPAILTTLYKSLVRPHLEYSTAVWSPHYVKDREMLEKVQRRFTRMVPGLGDLGYEERLGVLGLMTLEERRNRSDMVEMFRVLKGLSAIPVETFLELNGNGRTRGNLMKIVKKVVQTDIRKFFFSQRVINRWNSLDERVVSAETVDSFNPQMPKVFRQPKTPKGGGGCNPPGFLPSRPNFLKIFLMGMFLGSRNPTVIMKKFYLYCMTLKIKVKHLFA